MMSLIGWQKQNTLHSFRTRLLVPAVVSAIFMVIPVASHPATTDEGPVLITAGGDTPRRAENMHTDIYNVTPGSNIVWSHRGQDLPEAMLEPGATDNQTDIWMVYYSKALRYNIASDSWSRLNNTIAYRTLRSAVFILNKTLYVVGGDWGVTIMESLSLDDPDKGWRIHSVKFPYPIFGSQAVVIRDTAYIVSGYSSEFEGDGYLDSLYAWRQDWDVWQKLPQKMEKGRKNHCVVTDRIDRIFAIGGMTDRRWADNEEYSLIRGSWMQKAKLPEPLHGLRCVYHQGKIFAIGGSGHNGRSNKVYVYDTNDDSWQLSLRRLKSPLYRHGAFLIS